MPSICTPCWKIWKGGSGKWLTAQDILPPLSHSCTHWHHHYVTKPFGPRVCPSASVLLPFSGTSLIHEQLHVHNEASNSVTSGGFRGVRGVQMHPLWRLVMYFCTWLHEFIEWLCSSGMHQQQPGTVTHSRISSQMKACHITSSAFIYYSNCTKVSILSGPYITIATSLTAGERPH